MNTKLTLSIEESVIKKAKAYARTKGRSLSDIIENYLKTLTIGTQTEEDITPVVKSLRGSFKAPGDMDYKSDLSDELAKKYLSWKRY